MSVKNHNENIVLDHWLSGIFKKEVYDIKVDKAPFNEIEHFVKKLQMADTFLYSKVDVTNLQAVRLMECLGFYLVDTSVTFEKNISTGCCLTKSNEIRFAKPEDVKSTVELARNNFAYTRFFLDEKIDNEVANLVKAKWVENYFLRKRGTHMVVALIDGQIKGFTQLIKQDKLLIVDLIAVIENERNKGLGGDMMIFAEQSVDDIERIRVGTQVANVPAIRLYEKMGYRFTKGQYIFHYHSRK